jgi:DraIII
VPTDALVTGAIDYCGKSLPTRSRFVADKRCFDVAGHRGRCSDFPYLRHLEKVAKGVATKIKRDSTMTTGAAWLSDDAGFNRVQRWAMLLPDSEIQRLAGVDMTKLSVGVQRKLRDKAATYDDCIQVAQGLTWLAYGMKDAPEPLTEIREYLETLFGPIKPGSTTCVICRKPLSFDLFSLARRGRAEIESAHKNPRVHTPENVGFAHRFCNIAQGDLTLDEFYDWMEDVLGRVDRV